MKDSVEKQIAMRRILFATDFSENSRAALDYAKMVALHFGATVYMLHVVLLSQAAREAEIEIAGPSLSREAAERRLDTLAADLRQVGIPVELHIVDGLAGDVIPESVATYKIDLMVLGIHGLHHGLTYLLMGSTTELLLREADCPVLTVGASVLSGFDFSRDLDHIFFVSDLTPEGARAASIALFLAEAFRVPVHLGIWLEERLRNDEQHQREALDAYCRKLGELKAAMPPEWCQSDWQLSHAMRTEELVAKTAREHNSMIVLGIHTLNSSFARLVLSRSSSPVVTVLHERMAEPQ